MASRNKLKQCIEYYIENYPDLPREEQESMRLQWVNSHTPIHPLYYKRTIPGISDIEAQRMADEKLREGVNKQHHKVGLDNPAHKSNTTTIQRRQRSPKCIEFYEKKYPNLTTDEHQHMLDEHLRFNKSQVTRDKIVSCPEYWVARGVPEELAKQAALEWQHTKPQWSKQYCIKKYGYEIGLEVFDLRNKKWLNKLHKSFVDFGDGRSCQSRVAKSLFKILYKKLGITYPKREKFISVNGRHWALDFFHNDKVIEFNGDYWHANPKFYTREFVNRVVCKTAGEIWENDAQKLKDCYSLGYKVMVIWESDYRNNPEITIQKCLEFLEL